LGDQKKREIKVSAVWMKSVLVGRGGGGERKGPGVPGTLARDKVKKQIKKQEN